MATKRKQAATKPPEKKPLFIVDTLKNACIYYTVTTFLLIFLFWLISDDITRAMHPVALMLVLPFSLFFSAANTIFRHAPIATWLKVLAHYALTLLGVLLFLYLPNRSSESTGAGALGLFALLSVIYFIIMGVVLYFKARVYRIARDESKYTGVYKNK